MADRTFPVIVPPAAQCVCSVPWALVAPHERRAQLNHGQSLERLAERGGLSPQELLALLNHTSLRASVRIRNDVAINALHRMLIEFYLRHRSPAPPKFNDRGLLPCPHCGADTAAQDSSSGSHEVTCGTCQAYTWGDSPQEAITTWNRRVGRG